MARFLLWSVVFCVALLLIDQFFVHIPQRQPALAAARQFYVEFRQRLFALGKETASPSIESLIERERRAPAPSPPAAAPTNAPVPATRLPALPVVAPAPAATVAKPSGYVYADASGTLQMVEHLDQVPARYRASAQPLAR